MTNHDRTSLSKKRPSIKNLLAVTNLPGSSKAGRRRYRKYRALSHSLDPKEWGLLESMRRDVIEPEIINTMSEWELREKLHDSNDIEFYYSCELTLIFQADILEGGKSAHNIRKRTKILAERRRADWFKKYIRLLETCKASAMAEGKRWGSINKYDPRYGATEPVDCLQETSVAFGYGETPESVLLRKEANQTIRALFEQLSNWDHPRAAICH